MKKISSFLLLFGLLFLVSCSPKIGQWNEKVIKEGKHRASGYHFSWGKIETLVYRWKVDSTWEYHHNDNDQADWNKLSGFSFNLFSNHRNSQMTGWVYHPGRGLVYLAPYYHQDGGTYWAKIPWADAGHQVGEDLPFITAELGDEIETTLVVDRGNDETTLKVKNLTSGDEFSFIMTWGFNLGLVREIFPWFGGNKMAPDNIYFYLMLLKKQRRK
jgi:hypothetical protein